MGLWQNLVESYEANEEALAVTYPQSTTTISNKSENIVVIKISGDGKLNAIDEIKKSKKATKTIPAIPVCTITFPVTEKSSARSSKAYNPHPLFDQYDYLCGDEKKNNEYKKLLKEFSESEFSIPSIKSIYKYIEKGTLATELAKAVKNHKITKPKAKTNIIFEVEIPGNAQTKVWEDKKVFEAWHKFYMNKKRIELRKGEDINKDLDDKIVKIRNAPATLKKEVKAKEKEIKDLEKKKIIISPPDIDYINGKVEILANYHPKKISNTNKTGNAKLVSDNGGENFTFRGKFTSSREALTISYESSQKAHQFLRYLINSRGIFCGEQVIVSFSTMKDIIPPAPPITQNNMLSVLRDIDETPQSTQASLAANTGVNYAKALRKALTGGKYKVFLEKHPKTVILALDAATPGRLSIVFYREMSRGEYLEMIAKWHETCKWQFFYKDNQNIWHSYIGAPSIDKIIEAVYGWKRSGSDAGYEKIKKNARERLLHCIFDGELIPRDYIQMATNRVSNPLGITQNDKFSESRFNGILSTTCALLCKFYNEQQNNNNQRKAYDLSIQKNNQDRSYLYGRLLGAADKLEEYALYKNEKKRIVTNALRYMQKFSLRPYETWKTIHDNLNPYIQAIRGSYAFREIEEIHTQFKQGDFENKKSLDPSYLLGFYHERAYIDSLRKKKTTEENSETSTQGE